MPIDDINTIPPLDLSPEELEIGDTKEFVEKMNSLMAKFQNSFNVISENSQAIKTLRDQVVEQVNIATDANANAEGLILEAKNERLNLFSHDGTFMQSYDDLNTGFGGIGLPNDPFFNMFEFISPLNGSELPALTEVGRHTFNSPTYGGAVNALSRASDPIGDEFLFAVTDNNSGLYRFTPSFAVAEFRTGTGTSGTTLEGKYRFLQTNTVSMLAKRLSFSMWVQFFDDDGFVVGSAPTFPIQTYLDGVHINNTSGENNGAYHRLVKGSIHHLAFAYTGTTNGLTSTLINMMATPNTRIRIAMPWLTLGAFQMLPHERPIASFR